jgi:hypothetical protein
MSIFVSNTLTDLNMVPTYKFLVTNFYTVRACCLDLGRKQSALLQIHRRLLTALRESELIRDFIPNGSGCEQSRMIDSYRRQVARAGVLIRYNAYFVIRANQLEFTLHGLVLQMEMTAGHLDRHPSRPPPPVVPAAVELRTKTVYKEGDYRLYSFPNLARYPPPLDVPLGRLIVAEVGCAGLPFEAVIQCHPDCDFRRCPCHHNNVDAFARSISACVPRTRGDA